jgi:hypothetical protein
MTCKLGVPGNFELFSARCQPAGLCQAFLEEARRTGGETVSKGIGKRSDASRAVQVTGSATHAGR